MRQGLTSEEDSDIIELVGEAVERVDRLIAIRTLMAEVESIASSIAANWGAKDKAPLFLRKQIDRLLAKISQQIPLKHQNGKRFLLPSSASAIEGKKLVFNAYMAVGLWLLEAEAISESARHQI